MKSKIIFFILVLTALPIQSRVNDDINGYWGSEIRDEYGENEIILYLNTGSKPAPICEIHSYVNHVKLSSLKAKNIVLNYPSISMLTNEQAGVVYTGLFDSSKSTLTGKLTYTNGSDTELNFTKLRMEDIRARHPGLLNIEKPNSNYVTPAKFDDSWKTAEMSGNEFNIELLEEMLRIIHSGDIGSVHSILIVSKGSLVFEEYFDGFGWNDLHELRSSTKSIASLLVGIMIDKNYLRGVQEKLIDHIPNYTDYDKNAWGKVSIENILTMSVGLDWDEREHNMIWNVSNDVVQSTLDQSFKFNPGEKWEYRNPNVDLLAPVIINCTDMSVQSFADKYLFSPLKIKNYVWENFKGTDYPLLDGSLSMTPREMAKLGQLILDRGMWQGKRIISEEWIEKSTKSRFKVNDVFDYAYLWWLGKSSSRQGTNGIMSYGLGGQYIIVLPSLSLVVVTTGGNYDDMMSTGLLNLIDNYIIKSVLN